MPTLVAPLTIEIFKVVAKRNLAGASLEIDRQGNPRADDNGARLLDIAFVEHSEDCLAESGDISRRSASIFLTRYPAYNPMNENLSDCLHAV